jgi:hypothetical protein
MRFTGALLALGFVACSFGRADAEPAFADSLCPEASQYVIAAGKLRRDDSPQHVYETTQPVVNAYEVCSKRMLSNGYHEPQHYADTRAAQFAVLASRALIAMNRLDDAKRELTHWRPYVQQVVDWNAEAETSKSGHAGFDPNTNGADNRRQSLYHDSAKDIVAAIDGELARIDAISHDVARPQANASPAPHR